MIFDFGIEGGPSMRVDDELPGTRMTPEVAEDYMRRIREQVIAAYQEITAFDVALHTPTPEADDQR